VFITKTLIRGQLYNSLTLYGPVPSFNQCEKTMETLVMDFEEEIYEEKVTVFFHAYLRGIEKFNTPKELTDQIDKDIKTSLDFHRNPSKLSPILAFLKQS
jgi:riboflavin kinase/FMN adenylyltransferase